MRHILFFLVYILVGQSLVYAQSNEITVRNIKVDSFPRYNGELHIRNPNGIEKGRVKFLSRDSLVSVNISDGKKANEIAENKVVLFVILNNPTHRERTRWYNSVVKKAINRGMLKKGDNYAVVSFDCPRPEYDEGRHLLFPEKPIFTESDSELIAQLDQININNGRHSVCGSRGDIYGAIYESLDALNKYESNLPKSIVVLADDWSLTKQTKEQQIQKRSKDYNIPVYGITYDQNTSTGNWGVKSICEETYGGYFIDGKNNIDNAAQALLEFDDSMIARASGEVYEISFDANVAKGSETQTIQVQYEGQTTAFQYTVPAMTVSEWISENPLLAAAIGVGFIVLVILIIVWLKKRKRKREERDQLHKEELERMESEQQRASEKTSQQEREIDRLKEAEQKKEAARLQAIETKKKEESDAVKLQQMRSRGNLPWFSYNYGGEAGSFEILAPDFIVGRDEASSFQINLSMVSRSHFQLSFNDGVYSIKDLNSSNGTYVNGDKIHTTVLKHGDIVGIGDLNLTFHI